MSIHEHTGRSNLIRVRESEGGVSRGSHGVIASGGSPEEGLFEGWFVALYDIAPDKPELYPIAAHSHKSFIEDRITTFTDVGFSAKKPERFKIVRALNELECEIVTDLCHNHRDRYKALVVALQTPGVKVDEFDFTAYAWR